MLLNKFMLLFFFNPKQPLNYFFEENSPFAYSIVSIYFVTDIAKANKKH